MDGYGPDFPKPYNANPGKLASSFLVAAGKSALFGFVATSTNVAAQFIQVFDAAVLPADGAVPLLSLPVAATSFVALFYGWPPRTCEQGIIVCNSTTQGTKTTGAVDTIFDVQWVDLPVAED